MKTTLEQVTASSSSLSQLLNLSVRRIQQLVKAGLLPKPGPDGHRLLDAVPAYLRLLQRPAQVGNWPTRDKELIEVQTQIRQVELREKSGELVSRSAVEGEFFSIGRTVRDNLQNLPARTAGLVATERNQQRCYDLLAQEVNQILEGLRNGTSERGTADRVPNPR